MKLRRRPTAASSEDWALNKQARNKQSKKIRVGKRSYSEELKNCFSTNDPGWWPKHFLLQIWKTTIHTSHPLTHIKRLPAALTPSLWPGTNSRTLFVNFSLPFNAVIPDIFHQKHTQLTVPTSTFEWKLPDGQAAAAGRGASQPTHQW